MSNFDPNAIIRGAQLTVVGGEHVQLLSNPTGASSLLMSSSNKSVAESGALQVRALPTGRHRRCRRGLDQAADRCAGTIMDYGLKAAHQSARGLSPRLDPVDDVYGS